MVDRERRETLLMHCGTHPGENFGRGEYGIRRVVVCSDVSRGDGVSEFCGRGTGLSDIKQVLYKGLLGCPARGRKGQTEGGSYAIR